MSTLRNSLLIFPVSLLLLAGGCTDDKDAPVGSIPEKTFTSSNGLQLFYNGAEMPGKSVSFQQQGNRATLKAFSNFDMAQLGDLGLSGELICPGVIPGSVETTWNVDLIPGNGVYSFSSQDNNGQCSYKLSGTVTPDKLILNITDAVLTETPLSRKVWKPSPIIKDSENTFKSLPFYIDWEFDPLSEVDINLSPLLESLTTIPFIPVYGNTAFMSVSQALQQIVRTVVFRNDGNIIITYISSVGGAARIAQTQPNSLFYIPAQSGSIRLLINPLSLFSFILENTSGSTPPEEVDLTGTGLYPTGVPSSSNGISSILSDPKAMAIIKALMKEILPQLAEGIPLSYTLANNNLDIFIDTEASLSILKTVIDTFLENDEAIEAIISQLKKNESLAPLLEDLPKLRQMFDEAILKTTTLRIGFSFEEVV